jgi:iron(III) transport system ATP-binding protein
VAGQCKVRDSMNLPAEPVLSLQNLSHRYAARSTFSAFDLSLRSGTICCLPGPSGCGKTTVLRCIAGFERVEIGSICLGGAVISSAAVHLPPKQRHLGMVFQDYALFPHLTVERNVGFGV